MNNVVKFPYDASRRVHSRKPRRSKNGTPEERAAKAGTTLAAAPNGSVIPIARKPEHKGPTFADFIITLRGYYDQEIARGRTPDQIFDGLLGSYGRADRALQNRRPQSETSDFPVNLPDLGQPVLNLATEHDQ